VILSDGEIREALQKKKIIIEPIPTDMQYTTSALDLILGDEILELKTPEVLKAEEPNGVERPLIVNADQIDIFSFFNKYAKPMLKGDDGSVVLQPGRLAIGITQEYVKLPKQSKIAARVEGRSTLARLGLAVHLTAPTIHAGFDGRIVLEMINFSPYPLRLLPGRLKICQLIFERLGRIPKGPIRTKYVGQKGVR
jgi:dCTP deaminase